MKKLFYPNSNAVNENIYSIALKILLEKNILKIYLGASLAFNITDENILWNCLNNNITFA